MEDLIVHVQMEDRAETISAWFVRVPLDRVQHIRDGLPYEVTLPFTASDRRLRIELYRQERAGA